MNATIATTQELMDAKGTTFESTAWEGAGHAFMRSGEADDANEANARAAREAWSAG